MNIDSEILEKKIDENIDTIASVVHSIWSHWQKYLHEQCQEMPDGSLKIPKDLVEHWSQQILLDYKDLTDAEKESDIEQAKKYKKAFLEIAKEIYES